MNLPAQVLRGKTSAISEILVNLIYRTHENDCIFYDETHFCHMLRLEIMRMERYKKKPFLLLLLDISKLMVKYHEGEILAGIKTALIPFLREIDIQGWYRNHNTIGVIFTEVTAQHAVFIDLISHKIYDRFYTKLDSDWLNKIEISFHLLSETNSTRKTGRIVC
jgi:hypothetical protein